MIKSELVREMSHRSKIDQDTCKLALEAAIESMKVCFGKGEDLYIRGFATFSVKKSGKKVARNITKNTVIHLPEKNVLKIKASQELKDIINQCIS